MINLLPAEKKETLFLEQVKKMALVLGGAIVIGLSCMFLILLSIKFYILSEIVFQQGILDSSKSPEEEQIKNTVHKYNTIISLAAPLYDKRIVFSPAFQKITTMEFPSGVRASSIVLDKGAANAIKAVISGTSSTREDLVKFKEIIESDKVIKNIQFSPESWMKDKDVKFSLNFEIENAD